MASDASPPRRWPQSLTPISRGSARAIVSLFILAFLLSGGSYWLSVRAVQADVRARVTVVQLCQAGNESRAQQVTLWTHLVALSVPPPHESAVARRQRQAMTAAFLAYIRQVFAPKNCPASYGN